MNKLLFLIPILFLTVLFVPKVDASAKTLSIDCSSGCVKKGVGPLFSLTNDGYWYPGMSINKTINLKNSSPHVREMDMRAYKTSSSSDLEDVMTIEILNTKTGTIVWTGKLRDFYNKDKINMGALGSGDNMNYNFKALMDVNSGNDYQGLKSVFNLTLGFWPEEREDLATISGFKYFDKNGNNNWDGWLKGEFKMSGWKIFIDKNNNKKYDKGEESDITNWDGKYSFDKLSSGSYNICENQQSGWESSLGNHATCQHVIISSGKNKTGVNFGNYIASKKRK